ncbi:MAG: hypothetical protein AAFQ98_06175 [Bacteroidota bacterium]
MNKLFPSLRKIIIRCPQSRAYWESLSNEELRARLQAHKRQTWLAAAIWVAAMALIYFGSDAKDELLYLYIITGGSTVYLSHEEYMKHQRMIKEILNSRK